MKSVETYRVGRITQAAIMKAISSAKEVSFDGSLVYVDGKKIGQAKNAKYLVLVWYPEYNESTIHSTIEKPEVGDYSWSNENHKIFRIVAEKQ